MADEKYRHSKCPRMCRWFAGAGAPASATATDRSRFGKEGSLGCVEKQGSQAQIRLPVGSNLSHHREKKGT